MVTEARTFAEHELPAGAHRQIAGRLVIATHNPGKLREMRELLTPYGIEAVSAGELGLAEPEETGTSFAANARIKARAAAAASGLPAFADDFGLVVDALDGEPGIYSARWAGPQKDFQLAMATVEDKLRARGGAGRAPTRRAFRLRALRRLAGRPRRRLRGHGRRHAGVAAARRQGFRLRSDVPARRPRPHLRRDDERGETRPAAAAAKGSRIARARFASCAEACLGKR